MGYQPLLYHYSYYTYYYYYYLLLLLEWMCNTAREIEAAIGV
jgi:hypothetical protein